jgi:mono/diheme cytochrome c family protein
MKTNAETAGNTAVESGIRLLVGALGAGFVALGTATAQQGELPAGPNRELVAHECGACHDLEMVIAAAGASRQAWTETVDEMVRYGARIDPDDRPKIVEYLSSVLGAATQKPTVR